MKYIFKKQLQVKVENTKANIKMTKFNIKITTDNIALFVWLETDEIKGQFSDNGFLQVSKQKIIHFESAEAVTAAELQSNLRFTSLRSKEHL